MVLTGMVSDKKKAHALGFGIYSYMKILKNKKMSLVSLNFCSETLESTPGSYTPHLFWVLGDGGQFTVR